MPKAKPERKIQTSIEHALDYYQRAGVVVGYIDISDLGLRNNPFTGVWSRHKSEGEPDVVAWVSHQGMLYTLFIEVKNPASFKWGAHQKVFAAKFDNIINAEYILAFKAADVSQVIEDITGYSQRQLDEWDKNMQMEGN